MKKLIAVVVVTGTLVGIPAAANADSQWSKVRHHHVLKDSQWSRPDSSSWPPR